ncbi:hypothetical protein L5515_019554 [Caenorhabditis briggsae]|uniref:Sdz-33 F-box domain-containing protein n=1 Tax=Caenorhabditis briggsae TaxID=6238 RepID=A0AAE9FJ89_CAEBR|nr:hypothetical protein L5515_019554 [Caenorhabditis briggsae]
MDEPDDRDILKAQYHLRVFFPDVQKVRLHRVPLQANLSLQHIAIANLENLGIEYQRDLDLVDVSTWNVENCMIWTIDDQMSLHDLNRFFQTVD